MKNLLCILLSATTLTGCVGALLSGQTELLDEEFPDITTVPCRKEASADRGIHRKPEKVAREHSLKTLEKSKEAVRQENEALRSQYF